ncbi:hypothetical protein NP493_796g01030 [Ridgeia piscesae]|uniref:Uncharacterized protein n=1 Tax=Ridgeia piscesae TaxID=27915 RepID=A0AAD9KNL7_RIDPI|nr:hypothetical protein NP493_796g01030 [Ridgeia piscesae]
MSTHISLHPGRQNCLCLIFFPSRCIYSSFFLNPTHITSVFTKRTLNPCLLKIYFHSINCSWRFASPSATTARPAAYNSFWSMTFIQIFLLISSTTAINNNWVKALPCVTPTFTLDSPYTSGPHSSPLFVSPPPIGPPPGTPSTSVFPLSFLLRL